MLTVYQIYQRLLKQYGFQQWWPADSAFEVMVGAILTQNTSWTNVEKAIDNLKSDKLLSCDKLVKISDKRLAKLLTPVGYFNVKARRLKNFCHWYQQTKQLNKLDTATLRHELLSVNGVGSETADDILLYAFNRPVFVIDAYTRRIFHRLDLIENDVGYEQLRHWFEAKLKRHNNKVELFNEYHALIVRHGKEVCRARAPLCKQCCLQQQCTFSQ